MSLNNYGVRVFNPSHYIFLLDGFPLLKSNKLNFNVYFSKDNLAILVMDMDFMGADLREVKLS